MAEVDRNPSLPEKLVSELDSKPRSIDAWERMVLLLHKIDLRHEFDKSANEAAQAFDDYQAILTARPTWLRPIFAPPKSATS